MAQTPERRDDGTVSAGKTLRLDKVGKVFGRHRVLTSVSVAFEPGRICALLGGNGAGKSTLLALLALLVRPSSGTIRIGELSAEDAIAAGYRQHIGLLGHDAMVYRPLTGRQNLALFASLFGQPAAVVDAWLERLQLSDAADRSAATYSRGMLQRLSLGRALMGAPRLLLLDEPFSGLDRGSVAIVRSQLAERAAAGAVVVVVSHDLAPMADLATHVVVLADGRVGYEATAETVLSAQALADGLTHAEAVVPQTAEHA